MRVCCFLGQNIAKGHGKQNGKCVFYDRIQQQRAMDNKAENGLLLLFIFFIAFLRTEYNNKGQRKTNQKMRF